MPETKEKRKEEGPMTTGYPRTGGGGESGEKGGGGGSPHFRRLRKRRSSASSGEKSALSTPRKGLGRRKGASCHWRKVLKTLQPSGEGKK